MGISIIQHRQADLYLYNIKIIIFIHIKIMSIFSYCCKLIVYKCDLYLSETRRHILGFSHFLVFADSKTTFFYKIKFYLPYPISLLVTFKGKFIL